MDTEMSIPELFGCRVFNDEVMRKRLPQNVYESIAHTIETGGAIDASIADTVAAAMKEWAIELGATHYTHWFQPLTGVTAEKHDAFIVPDGNSRVLMEFSGKELIKGESDASSFPSGGLRATFEARGYTAWDPASYAFVKDGSLFIPTAFCSYTGEALDTKTPLLRSMDALSNQALRILRLFGDTETTRVTSTVGAEQEYFLIDRHEYDERRDLFYTGRTLFGAPAPKGQEMEDHYYGPLKTRVGKFMAELDRELWSLGINVKTKHNEVAPSQHELAPIYATTNISVDQNMLIMEYLKKVAARHDMVCLLHEKPFAGVNGSGKHNNWSLSTDGGSNLLKAGKTPAENTKFLLILAAVVRAVDEYQDLLRISVASAGNDHRLGANEAPPAIVSMFLGEELQAVVDSIVKGEEYHGAGKVKMDLHIPSIPTFTKDTTDRNRTSPFAFTGNKFEFRMVGSAQNIAMPNIVLNTAVADVFRDFADELEGAKDFDRAVRALIRRTFIEHARILFNGNGYSKEWEEEAVRRGLSNYRTSVEAYRHFDDEKNIALFERNGVLSRVEILARKEILFENYAKTVNIEAMTMVDMAKKDFVPAVNAYISHVSSVAASKRAFIDDDCEVERDIVTRLASRNREAYRTAEELHAQTLQAAALTAEESAVAYMEKVLPLMEHLRAQVDAMEEYTARDFWPVPSYGELTFSVQE